MYRHEKASQSLKNLFSNLEERKKPIGTIVGDDKRLLGD
jgi:hypothetical protein